MADNNREPKFPGLMDFDTFFDEVEFRHVFDAVKSISMEIDLVNQKATEVVDFRKRSDGRYNLFHRLADGMRVLIVLDRKANGRYFGVEGGFLWK